MAPRTFKKVTVAVSGTFPGYKQADLKDLVEGQGATFSTSVSPECTHLITTQKDVEKKSAKYKHACFLNTCEIVNLDWLLDSVEAKKPLAGKAYLFTAEGDDDNGDGDEDESSNKTRASNKRKKDEQDGDDKASKKRNDTTCIDDTENGDDKKMKDAQKASSKKLNVPVDEGCYMGGHTVHIDNSGLIWDATLNQTNAGANNNKFYRMQLLIGPNSTGYKTWTRWGRVGELGQSAMLGDGSIERAQAEFVKKFKDKSGLTWENRLDPPKAKKYTFIERNYEDSDDEDDDNPDKTQVARKEETPVESTLPESIQNLMTFIFNQQHFISAMASMSYDAQKMPLGKLSKRTLQEGFQILKDLSDLNDNPRLASQRYGTTVTAAAENLSNRYFTTIPHVFGRDRPPILNTKLSIKQEVELLETLTDMGVTNEIMKGKESKDAERIHALDRQFNGLGLQEMTRGMLFFRFIVYRRRERAVQLILVVDPNSIEYSELQGYLNNSRGATHHLRYKIVNIFRIERKGESDRFDKAYGSVKNKNRRLLWHGSRSTNYGGILSQGLRIAPPEAPVSGYMFGKGVYFADMSSKSANYCCPYNSGNMGLLLLCDVELGDPMYEQIHSNYNAATDSKREGKLATLGRGRAVPAGWKDAGVVHPDLKGVQMPDVAISSGQDNSSASLLYNEYIVYDVEQIQQKYLFQVHMS